jgi:hypothetical protein
MTMIRRMLVSLTILCGLWAAPVPVLAQGARYALVIQGASGEPAYAERHRAWLDELLGVLRDRFKYDAAHLVVLAEQPATGEVRATAENVRTSVAKLATVIAPADQLVVILIGHGSAQGTDAKFNLVGPDLAVAEWATMLNAIPGRVALINTTSASFPFVAGLAAPGRVVIVATSTAAQRFHTEFPGGFISALTSTEADLDKNGRVSLLEAFTYASRTVKQHYDQAGSWATETAVLDDDGDGKGRIATATGPDGRVAGSTYLDAPVVATSGNPEVSRLLARQQALNEQIDDLRRRQPTMAPEEFDRDLERLLTELATVSREVRRLTGG